MKKIYTYRTLVIAFTILITLMIASSPAFGQNGDSKESGVSFADDTGNLLTGVWESVSPEGVDCKTGEPYGANINALYSFAQGGTMYVEDTLPIEGPYRTTGAGIWARSSGRSYTSLKKHYSFDPDRTHILTIVVRTNLKVSMDGNSFTQTGVVDGFLPDGTPVFTGCFADTATRLKF